MRVTVGIWKLNVRRGTYFSLDSFEMNINLKLYYIQIQSKKWTIVYKLFTNIAMGGK